MMRLCGYELELFTDEVPGTGKRGRVRAGTDSNGGRWLIVRVDDDPEHMVWVCAPVSERALQVVANGNAAVGDVLRHSLTGVVEVVTVDQGRAVPDRCLLCADIPAALLPAGDRHIDLAA